MFIIAETKKRKRKSSIMVDFNRKAAKYELSRLLKYWRDIEFWIKKAELVQRSALIPAINELRYASRQIFNATIMFSKPTLTDGDKSVIIKRLSIAEQYLTNADHDISDAILMFIDNFIRHIEEKYSISDSDMIVLYPKYTNLKRIIRQCARLVGESRRDYDSRKINYGTIKEHLEHIVTSFEELEDCAIRTAAIKRNAEISLIRNKKTNMIMNTVSVAGTAITTISVVISIMMWKSAPTVACVKPESFVWKILCLM